MNLKVIVLIVIAGVVLASLVVLYDGKSASQTTFANSGEPNVYSELVMMETDGVKHLIPLDRIKGGGPPKDGIPSIDNPVFVDVQNSQFMSDSDTVIGLELMVK